MSIEDVKKSLEYITEYNIRAKSLEREINESKGTMIESKLRTELEELTDKIIYVRNSINEIKNSKIRKVILLRYVDGLTFAEISKKVHTSLYWTQELHKRGLNELSNLM